MTKIFRYLSYLVIAVIFLVIGLALFSQTSLFKNWLKDKVVSMANERLNATLNVGALQGNLFTHLLLTDISLRLGEQPVAQIRRIAIRLRPFSLLTKTLNLSRVTIESPILKLSQQDSVSWNYQQILKQSSLSGASANSEQSPFDWKINAPDIQISSGQADIYRLAENDSGSSTRITDLNLNAGLWIEADQVRTVLEGLSFTSYSPHFVVQTIQADMTYDSNKVTSKNFQLVTPNSKLRSELAVFDLNNPTIDFEITGQPISMSDVRRVFPGLNLVGNPHIEIEASGNLEKISFKSKLTMGGSEVTLSGLLQLKNEPYEYHIKGAARNLNLAAISTYEEFESDLHFDFHIEGQGVEWGKIYNQVTVDLDTSVVFGRPISNARLTGEIAGDSILVDINVVAERARFSAAGILVANAAGTEYELDGQLTNFDVSKFLPDSPLSTDANLLLHLQGRGIDFENANAELTLNIQGSRFDVVPVDSGFVDIQLENRNLKLRNLAIQAPAGRLTASGSLSMQGQIAFDFEAELGDLSTISNFVQLDSLGGFGAVTGSIKGMRDSLQFQADVKITDLRLKDNRADSVNVNGSGVYLNGVYSLEIKGNISGATAAGLENLSSNYTIKHTNGQSDFWIRAAQEEGLALELQGQFRSEGPGSTITLEDCQFAYRDHKWRKMDRKTVISITDTSFDITDFKLNSRDQMVRLWGHFDKHGSSDLNLQVRNLQISKYDSLFNLSSDLDGRVNMSLSYSGELNDPFIDGAIEVSDGRVLDVPFERFSGDFQLDRKSARWDFALSKTPKDSLLESSGFIPIELSLEPMEYRLLDDEPLELKFNARGLDLSLLQPFTSSITEIKGNLIADIVLSNTLRDLKGIGPIRLVDGEFNLPALGTRYRNINAAMLLKDNNLIIRDFRIRSEDGKLELIEGGLSLSKQNLKDFRARFKVDDFTLMNTKKMKAKVKGEIELSGSVQSPYFSGSLSVSESSIFYPAWFENEAVVELSSQPFFVIAPDSVEWDSTGALRFQKTQTGSETAFTESEFYRNLRGELALKFPRNSWIRSQDTNIEISGDLVTVKEEGADIALFGSLSTLRGYYELLGNRFQIVRGNLVFYGQAEPDPGIDIEAEYEFRDTSGLETEKHVFTVLISGTLSTPEFRFTLDGSPAAQADVLSILVFGQSADNLTINQKSSVSQNSGLGNRATGLITGQVLKRLSGELGKELSLDVIQIESGKNFEDARLRIGKYVTPDVFVIVSQDFGNDGNRKIELEYEIPVQLKFINLLLQASQERRGATGLDLIWKFEW